jgi:hypothetical protein
LFGERQAVGGEAEVYTELMAQLEHLIQGAIDGRLATAERDVESFAGQCLCFAHNPEHDFLRQGGVNHLVDGAKGAGEVAAAAENDVIIGRGGEHFTGFYGNPAGDLLLKVRYPLDDRPERKRMPYAS